MHLSERFERMREFLQPFQLGNRALGFEQRKKYQARKCCLHLQLLATLVDTVVGHKPLYRILQAKSDF